MTHCPRCGKTNLDPEYPHTCTPLALRLAGDLESGRPVTGSAAEELRRLHAENEAKDALLRQALAALDGLYLPGELERVNAAITAIRARLEPPPKPA